MMDLMYIDLPLSNNGDMFVSFVEDAICVVSFAIVVKNEYFLIIIHLHKININIKNKKIFSSKNLQT